MHTRDAQGRQVSLLNDDPPQMIYQPHPYLQSAYSSGSGSSLSSAPEAPVLVRSNSYDSQNSGDALTPTTPGTSDYGRVPMAGPGAVNGYPRIIMGEDYCAMDSHSTPSVGSASRSKRAELVERGRSTSYDEDSSANSSLPDRPGKRYPCRYRTTHGCDKTFTTSGHASRHSKIHTAEKAVPCTYPNCHKKFTRADNMKQHLETHYKDKSRSGSSRSSGSSRRTSTTSSRTGSNHQHHSHHHHRTSRDAPDILAWEAAQYAQHQPHSPQEPSAPSPVSGTAWDLRTLDMGLGASHREPKSGLDALAMAVACQEGGGM